MQAWFYILYETITFEYSTKQPQTQKLDNISYIDDVSKFCKIYWKFFAIAVIEYLWTTTLSIHKLLSDILLCVQIMMIVKCFS